MATKSPVFPTPEPQHFSDYGFDPQIDYFQVLEEARKQKREATRSSMDTLHFKLPKPITSSRDEPSKKIKKSKKRWWKNALHFLRRKWATPEDHCSSKSHKDVDHWAHHGRSFGGSISGPIYITESRSGSGTPYRTTSRPLSGPLAGTLTPTRKGEVEIPYISLRELNMDHHHDNQRMSTSAMPIYLVT